MTNISAQQQALEAQYFNWKCLICNVLAASPMELENQQMVFDGVYTDIDGSKWVKCDKCMSSYHLNCVSFKTEAEVNAPGCFLCTFFGLPVNTLLVSLMFRLCFT